jgi:3'-5' exoribonuclease
MSRTKPPLLRLCEMQRDQAGDFFALLAERTRNHTRDGRPFYLCKFRDARRTATAMIWADNPHFEKCDSSWRHGECYKIRGAYHESERYGAQIEIQQIRAAGESDQADGFDPASLVECSRFGGDEMLSELRALVAKEIAAEPLRRLVLTIVERHAAALRRLPATRDQSYHFAGGLLEHTLAVTKICTILAEMYATRFGDMVPPFRTDLVVAGAVLRDIGRVLEFDASPADPQPTVSGRLIGHVVLGRDLVRDAARELGDVDGETLELLDHIFLAQLPMAEGATPKWPLVPEALLVHRAAALDAEMETYLRCLTRDQQPGPFTARDQGLGKRLFKGRVRE